nr:FliH/SctL family protein [uncultured Anaerotignum sp.]
MPNLLKFYNKKEKVEKYSFNEYFEEARNPKTKEKTEVSEEETPAVLAEDKEQTEAEVQTEEKESANQQQADEIILQAREEAERILAQAQEEAAAQKERAAAEGYQEGFDKGYHEGYTKSAADVESSLQAESQELLEEIKKVVTEVSCKKEEILEKYKQDLKNIAIAIGEKVIQVSLKSSGSVIEKMILSATEKLRTREWAKIYISKADANLLVRGDHDILQIVGRLSENLKIIVMEKEKPGTCIIELPDEIIDASASTQVENIKGILKNTNI